MRRAMISAAIACLAISTVVAGPSEDKVIVVGVVQKFFDTMTMRDVDGARDILVPEGRFFSIRNRDGEATVRTFTNQEYLDGLEARETLALERMWEPKVNIHHHIANVWTRYDFYVDGKFSHCGVDSFDLIKTSDGWKISGGTYTVEHTGCPESPLGPPK